MKKFLLSLLFLASCVSVQAETIIKVYWPFPVGDGQSVYLKSVLDQANEIQKEYTFVLLSTPGAGGLIAVNHVLSSTDNTLLAHTSSYFIRPLVYQQGKYEFSSFRPIAVVGETPFAIVKQKNNNQPLVKIGISGLGSTTHVISLVAKTQIKNLEIIPYKGLTDSLIDVRNRNIDAAFNFVQIAEQYDDLIIVGTTGAKQIKNYPLLKNVINKDMEHFNSPLFVMAPSGMDQKQFNKLQEVLLTAINSDKRLLEMMKRDYASFSNVAPGSYNSWYQQQINNYKKFTQGVKLD
jgi:tripartite-type tricarboxylate transporter receptor subunit TctC